MTPSYLQVESTRPLLADETSATSFIPSIAHRILGLDELRGFAILTVMGAHFYSLREVPGLEQCHFGAPGVDLFFMISGFLIAKILIESKGRVNYFQQFYVRRSFRILPLYLLVTASLTVASSVAGADVSSWPFYLVFLQNFLNEPLHAWSPVPGLAPLWSLAVEEQFYICLPLVIYFFPRRTLPLILLGNALLGLSLKYFLQSDETANAICGYSNPTATWFRMQYLAMGCLVASDNSSARHIKIFLCCWLALAIYLGSFIAGIELMICVLFLWLILRCIKGRPVLLQSGIAWIGKLCFGLYLLHMPILIIARRLAVKFGLSSSGFLVLMAYFALTFVAAAISYSVFEMPFSRLRTRFEGNERQTS